VRDREDEDREHPDSGEQEQAMAEGELPDRLENLLQAWNGG
jgi:hypothetical protein